MKPVAEVFNIINEQTRQRVENPVIKVLEKGNIVGLANHTLLVRRDGTKIPIDDSGAPIKDKDGKVTGVVLVFRDITDRKRADEALKESEQNYRLLVEHAPSGIYEIDFVEKRIKTVNEAACRMLGFTEAEVLAMNPMDILDPDSRPVFLDRLRKAQAGEALSEAIEYKAKRKDGTELWGMLHSKFKYRNGSIVGAFVVVHDITERKRATDILRTTVQRFFTVLSSMYASILLVADNGRVEFANQAFCDLFGLKGSAAELTGLTSAETIERIKDAYLRPNEEVTRIREIVGRGQPVRGEEIAMRGDRTCLRDFIPIYVNGKTLGRLWVHLEITERKRTEEALAAAIERASWLARFPDENPNPVMRVALDGSVLYCNPAAKELAGWKIEVGQMLGGPLLNVFGKAIASGTEAQEEVELGGKLFNVGVMPIPEGSYANFYGRDVTERKQAEEALRESERRERERATELAALLDSAPSPVFIAHDRDCLHITGNKAADDLLRNPRGGEASLSAPSEMRPGHFKAIKDGRELRTDELPAQRAARGIQVRDFEFSLVFEDGATRHVLGNGTPLWDEQKKARGSVLVLADITERKRAEEALRKAKDELEVRVQERTEELAKSQERLQQLSSQLLLAQEKERKRVAVELHDGLMSELAAMKYLAGRENDAPG